MTLGLWCLVLAGCGLQTEVEYSAETGGSSITSITVPDHSDTARQGALVFEAKCAECHGPHAQGTSEGPPLVHIIYEPGHHADASFFLAVRQGTRQHHWNFGPMEPVEGVSDADLGKVVCYVRELQYANGIFSDPDSLAACRS